MGWGLLRVKPAWRLDDSVQTARECVLACQAACLQCHQLQLPGLQVLNRVQHAGLLELTLNPRSFAQTVENMFTLSFLVSQCRLCTMTGQSLLVSASYHALREADRMMNTGCMLNSWGTCCTLDSLAVQHLHSCLKAACGEPGPRLHLCTTADWLKCIPMQVRDSKVKFLKDEELGTVVHVHKPQKAQQQQQQQVGDQGYCVAGGLPGPACCHLGWALSSQHQVCLLLSAWLGVCQNAL